MLKFEIKGHDTQIVEVTLSTNESVMAEAGTMLYMEEGIAFETRSYEAPDASFLERVIATGSRFLAGDALFFTHFTNTSAHRSRVAFTTAYPGSLIAIELGQCMHQRLILQKDSLVCAAPDTHVSIHLNPNLRTGLLGGEGFLLQKLQGEGTAILHAAGSVIEKTLYRETLRVEPGSVVAFEGSIELDVENTGNLSSMLWGGEGAFLATLSGEGRVWLQSMPVRKLLSRLSVR
ncbi:MAG: AIM24 family protein [Bernardetiaceae bacterium]